MPQSASTRLKCRRTCTWYVFWLTLTGLLCNGPFSPCLRNFWVFTFTDTTCLQGAHAVVVPERTLLFQAHFEEAKVGGLPQAIQEGQQLHVHVVDMQVLTPCAVPWLQTGETPVDRWIRCQHWSKRLVLNISLDRYKIYTQINTYDALSFFWLSLAATVSLFHRNVHSMLYCLPISMLFVWWAYLRHRTYAWHTIGHAFKPSCPKLLLCDVLNAHIKVQAPQSKRSNCRVAALQPCTGTHLYNRSKNNQGDLMHEILYIHCIGCILGESPGTITHKRYECLQQQSRLALCASFDSQTSKTVPAIRFAFVQRLHRNSDMQTCLNYKTRHCKNVKALGLSKPSILEIHLLQARGIYRGNHWTFKASHNTAQHCSTQWSVFQN